MLDSNRPILVIDRPGGALLFQQSVLRRGGRQIAISQRGSEAVATMRTVMPRLVVFAYDLVDCTGPELCREIRQDELLRATSLLFVADRGASDHVDLCMAAGCNDILLLPFRVEELDQKVERLATIPRRQSLRTLIKIDISVRSAEWFGLGHTLNISSSGMLIEVNQILPAEARISLQFYLRGDNVPLRLPAVIVRADFSGTQPRYGLRFTAVSHGEKQRINEFVGRMRSREQN